MALLKLGVGLFDSGLRRLQIEVGGDGVAADVRHIIYAQLPNLVDAVVADAEDRLPGQQVVDRLRRPAPELHAVGRGSDPEHRNRIE